MKRVSWYVLTFAIAGAFLALSVERIIIPMIDQLVVKQGDTSGVCHQIAGQDEAAPVEPLTLSAPAVCDTGVLVRLGICDSDVEGVKWKVLPETPNFEVIEQGRRAFFSSPDPGSYLFIVAGAKGGQAFLVHHTLIVEGDEPGPGPKTMSLTPRVRQLVARIPDYPKKRDHMVAVADVFTKMAESDESIEKIQEATALSTTAVLGSDFEKWRSILDKLGALLDGYTEKGLLVTRDQYSEAWLQIAKGLQ